MAEAPTQLAQLSKLKTSLAQVVRLDEFKEIRDKAEALRGYAKTAHLGLESQNMAAEVKIRAERGGGELLRDDPDFGRGKKSTTSVDLGISWHDSSRWQAIAGIPERAFEKHITDILSSDEGELTTAGMLKLAKLASKQDRKNHATEVVECAPLDSLPEDHFGCIYADPPWPYQNQATRASTSNHYPTMTLDDICALPVGARALEKSHLWLWTTNGFLKDSFAVIEAWGFNYKSVMIWSKPQMGIGNYVRVCHEFLMIATRGGLVGSSTTQRSLIEHDRMKHSQKPEVFRGAVEAVSPGPYLELFARRQIVGWTVWGNQVEKMLLLRS